MTLFRTTQEMLRLAKASLYFSCTMYELFTNLAATKKRDEHSRSCKSLTPAAIVSEYSRVWPDLEPKKKYLSLPCPVQLV